MLNSNFKMSKHICKPKTQHDIHKLLCAKSVSPRSKYELLGPFDKYRDEHYEIYKQKCTEFKKKALEYNNENIRALSNHKPKLGIKLNNIDTALRDESDEIESIKANDKVEDVKSGSNLSLLINTTENGDTFRKRHERYCNEMANVSEKLCNFEPWFKRYLILIKFITAARKVIIRNRMLKNLEKLKKLTKEQLASYENQYKKIEHLSYGHIFDKFC